MFDITTLFLEICSCGNSCKHCYIPQHKTRFKDLATVRPILDNFAGLLEPPAVTKRANLYFHDDPTLHPKIIEILEYSALQGIVVCPTLSTNGMGLARRKDGHDILTAFKQCGIKGLQLSLYGNEAYHDRFTGVPGSYRDRQRTAQLAHEAGLRVYWSLYLTKENPEQLIALAPGLVPDKHVVIHPPNYSSTWMSHHELHPAAEQIEIIRRRAPEYLSGHHHPEDGKADTMQSESGWMQLCRSAEDVAKYLENDDDLMGEGFRSTWLMEINGDLYDAEECLPEYKVGNVFNDRLREIYREDKHSRGYKILNNSDSRWLAEQAGDANGTMYGTLDCMRALWTSRLLARERAHA